MELQDMIEIFNERVEELKADIKEFTIMELEATTEKNKFKYGMKLSQTKDLLNSTKEALKLTQDRLRFHNEIESDIDDLMNKDPEDIEFEDIERILAKMFKR